VSAQRLEGLAAGEEPRTFPTSLPLVQEKVFATHADGLRIVLAYDCLFPWTVGGAERWYRALAEELVACGHHVTYLTRRQWTDDVPDIAGVDVVAVSASEDLYDDVGTRRLGPTLRYGLGVLGYLSRNRHRHDLVHTANFPFWSVLAARAALAGTGIPLVVDWHEVWSLRFWRSYVGLSKGTLGFVVQRLCIASSTFPVVTSDHNAARYMAAGGAAPDVLPGYFPDQKADAEIGARVTVPQHPPYVLFAGRHIADKGIDLIPDLAAELRRRAPELSLVVAGDGPQRAKVEAAIAHASLSSCVRFTGFVDDDEFQQLMAAATGIVVPSRREGYGMVVAEAAALGVPAVVAGFEENLAVAHIEEGVNGFVSAPDAASMAASIVKVLAAGQPLRASTFEWFDVMSKSATMSHSLRHVVGLHLRAAGAQRSPASRSDAA
jgi:glycosyltransferase involved in cell wall biosynthesis